MEMADLEALEAAVNKFFIKQNMLQQKYTNRMKTKSIHLRIL